MYGGSAHSGTSTVTFTNVGVNNCQTVPSDEPSWGYIKALYEE
jgi:hypothetical protein